MTIVRCNLDEIIACRFTETVVKMLNIQPGSFLVPRPDHFKVIIRTQQGYCKYAMCHKVDDVWWRELMVNEVSINYARIIDPCLDHQNVEDVNIVWHFDKLKNMMSF